ncbi:hypothetical protein LB545_01255 [Mesorhizobium sp. BR1-1-6]|uniref:hypothetical protein n=1 Tax=Mesorhizobium sp. BR1-1-6 TaxID=2876648 RepID=UPI001CD0793D|nr:hypothetical protein [Mesorhizobium sp. BR1-1-6]MBZ9892952.1 hypothetical protein [Mesorhizobium sp. BR1-1-6]
MKKFLLTSGGIGNGRHRLGPFDHFSNANRESGPVGRIGGYATIADQPRMIETSDHEKDQRPSAMRL